VDEDGLLASCVISGHAEAGPRGGDIVCAAVSVLSRTALRTLSAREGLAVRGEAPGRGEFRLETGPAAGPADRAFLAAAGTFLLEGLRSVAAEYPRNCKMTVKTERRN
jgi:uncharacterized protein YsxB (DUF464 family)